MGQDSEEAAEFVATVRTEHVVMKNWYMGSSSQAQALRQKNGPYPSLWKEVLNWPGWKESRREYLRSTQMQGQSQSQTVKSEGGNINDAEAVPRKRKSRWGKASSNDDSNNNDTTQRSKPRWGNDTTGQGGQPAPGAGVVLPPPPGPPIPGMVLPGMPANLPPHKQEEMRKMQARLREINDKMANLESEAARVDALPRGHRGRSPSPPPEYGADGKRKNTRAVRWKERHTAERQDILEKLMNLNPTTRQSNLFVRKRTKKIRIPIEAHPNYNFIGLIIGPRGKTQKELESKTGCKIAIRGRGSVKEGARGRRDGKVMDGDNEPLHVIVTGQDQKAVDAAADMIEQMLVVIDDEANMHKQQQLRELALLNGTLKEEEYCSTCAEKGHRAFECPRRFSMNQKTTVQIKCAICGDTSHPTRDCTQKPSDHPNQQELDSDYMSFMAELDGKKVEKSAATTPNGAPPVPETTKPAGNANGLTPPPPNFSLPPPPGPQQPPSGLPPPVASLPPPPPPVGLPPPPSQASVSVVPPPHGGGGGQYYGGNSGPPDRNNHNGGYQQQQYNAYGNGQQNHGGNQSYHHQQQQQYPPQHQQHGQQQQHQQYPPQHQQQGQQQGQQQQQQQVKPGEETTGWDPSSYYGNSAAGGAGGFNWWEK